MDLHPLWMLAPWAVFALAAGVKFWRITAVFRKRGLAGDFQERCRRWAPIQATCWKSKPSSAVVSSVG